MKKYKELIGVAILTGAIDNIVETINHFAHSLGVKTVAEFVHNEEVFNVVKEIGIDYSQGFYLGKPSPEIKS
ncbi:MAG TPA: EAL domain-containing protein [Hydrogenothermaceae bacterium]|nr:EAL domain-containing protein [Hydrogenothermaceae bacterium]